MSRRREMGTDDSASSATSITDSLRGLINDSWNAGLSLLTDTELKHSSAEYILGRMLSTKSAISTDSSLAEMNQRAQDDAELQVFSSIGAGQCGTIYALKGTTMVIKLPNSPEKADELYRDLNSHRLVHDAFQGVPAALRIHVHVPALKTWVNSNSLQFWDAHANLFHSSVQVPNYGLVSERIYPLPQPVRSALVDAFAPKAIKDRKQAFLSESKNKDCLVRVYLGRRNDDAPPVSADRFHLRNFPLHANEMEKLKLDTTYYAHIMAQALAIMHWRAGLDANDVEFVFGSSPNVTKLPTVQDLQGMNKDNAASMFRTDFQHRTVSIWLLDFNLCQPFTEDDAGLKKLVDAFYWNDPYYPRPTSSVSKDKELWTAFSRHYIAVSGELVQHGMPKAFITAVEERGKRRSAHNLFG